MCKDIKRSLFSSCTSVKTWRSRLNNAFFQRMRPCVDLKYAEGRRRGGSSMRVPILHGSGETVCSLSAIVRFYVLPPAVDESVKYYWTTVRVTLLVSSFTVFLWTPSLYCVYYSRLCSYSPHL